MHRRAVVPLNVAAWPVLPGSIYEAGISVTEVHGNRLQDSRLLVWGGTGCTTSSTTTVASTRSAASRSGAGCRARTSIIGVTGIESYQADDMNFDFPPGDVGSTMTIVEPIADLQWGRGNWQDYISNWRTRDTNWMQQRLILRYQTSALRTADWGATPSPGQVTYNGETQTLEMWRPSANTWVRSLMFQYLISTQDSAAGTNIHHAGSGGKGITIGPTVLAIDTPTTAFLS